MRTLVVKARNSIEMLTMHLEVCYEIFIYKSKLSQINSSFFLEFNFLKKDIYVNKGTLRIFDIFY